MEKPLKLLLNWLNSTAKYQREMIEIGCIDYHKEVILFQVQEDTGQMDAHSDEV